MYHLVCRTQPPSSYAPIRLEWIQYLEYIDKALTVLVYNLHRVECTIRTLGQSIHSAIDLLSSVSLDEVDVEEVVDVDVELVFEANGSVLWRIRLPSTLGDGCASACSFDCSKLSRFCRLADFRIDGSYRSIVCKSITTRSTANSRHVRQPIPRQPRLLPSPNHHHRQSVDVKRSRLQVWYPHRRRACACQSLVWPARSACITSPCRCKSIKLSQPSQRLLSNCSSPSSYRKQLC